MTVAKKDWAFVIVAVMVFGLRLWLGRIIGCSFDPTLYHDDMLLINYSDLRGHFVTQDLPPQDALSKNMGFPLILYIIRAIGLPYTDAIAILWLMAALMTVVLIRILRGEQNFLVDTAIFAFVLFTPIAFDFNTGPKIYRNVVLPPLYFITLTMMASIFAWHFIKPRIKNSRLLLFNVSFGAILTLTYYVKEDGLWLLMCLVAASVICLIKIVADDERRLIYTATLLIPLMIFALGTTAYKSVNQKYFGVYLINNRTDGELADFLKLIYKIQSDDRTASVWAPADAILKAFDASATLSANPKLKDAIIHTRWFGGDITANPIPGEYLGWVMLSALYDSGTCHKPIDQENFLRTVNDELKAAFETGKLSRDNRITFLPLMGSMSADEIFSLRELIKIEYTAHLTLNTYLPGALPLNFEPFVKKFGLSTNPADYGLQSFIITQKTEPAEIVAKVSALTKINFAEENVHASIANRIIEKIFSVYAVIQCVLFVAAILGVGLTLRAIVLRKNFSCGDYLTLTIALAALILSLCYAFAVAWFCVFIRDSGNILWFGFLKYYSTALVPMLMLFEISGARLLHAQKFIDAKYF